MTALNATAKAALKAAGVSQARWARANYMSDGRWCGDVCGCPAPSTPPWTKPSSALTISVSGVITVVHGNARGGDKMADAWAVLPSPLPGMTRKPERHGLTRDHWYPGGRFDPSAGIRRNGHMIALGADEALAFADECRKSICTRRKPHDSHGTADAIARADAAGIPLRRYVP